MTTIDDTNRSVAKREHGFDPSEDYDSFADKIIDFEKAKKELIRERAERENYWPMGLAARQSAASRQPYVKLPRPAEDIFIWIAIAIGLVTAVLVFAGSG